MSSLLLPMKTNYKRNHTMRQSFQLKTLKLFTIYTRLFLSIFSLKLQILLENILAWINPMWFLVTISLSSQWKVFGWLFINVMRELYVIFRVLLRPEFLSREYKIFFWDKLFVFQWRIKIFIFFVYSSVKCSVNHWLILRVNFKLQKPHHKHSIKF